MMMICFGIKTCMSWSKGLETLTKETIETAEEKFFFGRNCQSFSPFFEYFLNKIDTCLHVEGYILDTNIYLRIGSPAPGVPPKSIKK